MPARRLVSTNDQLMAVWATWILFATILIWTISGGSGGPGGARLPERGAGKYIIYSLPFTLGGAYWLSFGARQLKLDLKAAAALGLYLVVAATGLAANDATRFYAFRDIAIVSGYLSLFVFWFRAPASVLNVCVVAVAVCMGIEGATRISPDMQLLNAEGLYAILGLSNPEGTTLFGPHSLLESTLGFPLGVLVLSLVHNRRWRFAAAAALLQLFAFKRISFAGVALALAFNALTHRTLSLKGARRLALGIAVGLSLTAMFSTAIFENVSGSLRLENSSANAISLGRYDIAVMLWKQLSEAAPANWLIGFGAGGADAVTEQAVPDLKNPHNDWLKILFDYGVCGWVVMHAVFFMILARHRLGLMIYLYTAMLMMTDNIFIYMFYYPFVAMAMCVERE